MLLLLWQEEPATESVWPKRLGFKQSIVYKQKTYVKSYVKVPASYIYIYMYKLICVCIYVLYSCIVIA